MSSTGPEVLFGPNKRPERVSFPPFYHLQERTYIRPATLSSWLKPTILLCYKQADQQALDLVQVKAHDIRAFAASKAFYGGVSVDTDNNMYLGPVVAAQQVLDPSPQTSCPRKEKRGGGGGGHIRYNQVFRSLSQDLGIPLPSRCYG